MDHADFPARIRCVGALPYHHPREGAEDDFSEGGVPLQPPPASSTSCNKQPSFAARLLQGDLRLPQIRHLVATSNCTGIAEARRSGAGCQFFPAGQLAASA
jgi:hypothetical protein